MQSTTFGVDLITFFHPGFWDCADESAVIALGDSDPRAFWDRMLDALVASGIDGIELTFAPFDWRTAVRAYGNTAGFVAALSARGLHVMSGFFADVAIGGDLDDPARRAAHVESARAYAEFLHAAGCDVMVMGLPMRRSWDHVPPMFVDIELARGVAAFCHELAAATLGHGVRLALHTEAHSIFCTARDIDLLMLLTDPVYVGFCPDTAHITLVGSDPIAVVERHKDRVLAAHWKDAQGRVTLREPIDAGIHHAHRPLFRALGAGEVQWDAWIALLDTIGFDGPSILEIDAVADPAGELRRSRAYVDARLAHHARARLELVG